MSDFDKAQEMVVASMEYVKVLGFRIRKTEEISETWKKAAQTHAEECVKLREQLHHLRTAAESGMLPQIVKERDALRAECDRLAKSAELAANSAEIERLKKPARRERIRELVNQNQRLTDPPEATHDTPAGKDAAESAVKREPKPGDTVRLVKVPTQEDYPMQSETWNPEWGQVGETQHVDEIRTNSRGTRVAELESGWQWPLSCIEIVEDAK